MLVARAISSPTLLLKVGVSNGAISLQYIHSRADLSVSITFSEQRLFSRAVRNTHAHILVRA